jgi:hypothetical protein
MFDHYFGRDFVEAKERRERDALRAVAHMCARARKQGAHAAIRPTTTTSSSSSSSSSPRAHAAARRDVSRSFGRQVWQRSGQTVVKSRQKCSKRSNSGQTVVKLWSNSGQTVVKQWSNSGQTVANNFDR